MMKRYVLFTLLLFAIPASAAQQRSGDRATITPAPSFVPVTHERLLNSDAEPENWLMYSGNYFSQRYSRLSQIDKENAGQLEMQWAFQLEALDRAETTPLVVDGVMYVTESPSNVIALDARTGSQYWRYNHELPEEMNFCCGRNNRGVAVLGDRLYMTTLDAHIVALDAKTGTVLWDSEVADEGTGYSITGAPLIVGDKIMTGVGGGEYGIRGFVDAYEAETGELAWRLYTIPGPDHPDNVDVGGQLLAHGRLIELDDRLVRSRVESGLLGHWQSRPRLERRRQDGRQPVLRRGAGH